LDKLEDWQTLISNIQESSDAAISVLTDLINYDKIASCQLELDIRAMNLWDLIESTCKPFNVQARQANITFTKEFEVNMQVDADRKFKMTKLVSLGDEMKLIQVFRNVISNALKFTSHNGYVKVTGMHVHDSNIL
jgi:two-component system cell cycle sensor histidine kinase PleC